MKHFHSLIWNPATRSYGPAPEFAHSRLKGRNRKLILALAIAAVASGAQAAPTGGVVVSGGATINVSGTNTAIDQSTDAVTINWQGFDINADEIVTFYQPDANSLALNRVLSGNGTEIQGQLNANGRVFILDANGVLFGETAQVNVGSLVASTLDMTSADFANNHFEFSGSGNRAAVTNLGQITVADTGAVALLGGRVTNNGIIRARLGNVALAAGNQMTLDFAGDGLLNVKIDEGTAQALVHNGGLIQADGGSVLMTAHASDALLQTVVNNTGVIEARTLQEQDGKIMLLGGFNGGTVNVRGTLDVSAPEGGDGGFVETSGAVVKVHGDAQIKLASASGEAGSWLIDPTDMEISYDATGANDNVSHVHTQALQNSLAGGNVILTTADAGGDAGNITIIDPIVWASGNRLTLNADNNIIFNDYLHAPNGGLTLNALGNITTGAEGHINVGSFILDDGNFSQIAANLPTFIARDFTLNGGTFTRATGGNGTGSPLQITDIYGLQGLATTPTFNAVLVNNIDASGTSGWNAGAGFQPIGYEANLNGADFEIDGLFISRPGVDAVGLFSMLGGAGSVSNLGLTNVNITGQTFVGGLAGASSGDIYASYVTGSVSATSHAGGLVGYSDDGAITSSYSTADITGTDILGGLVGLHMGDAGIISDSYATGSVTGNAGLGGLIGWTGLGGSTVRSYASGEISGANEVGGLVGIVETDGSVVDSYWDVFTTGAGAGFGANNGTFTATGVNGNWAAAPDAYNQGTYAALDFTNTWFIAEGSSRPMLRAFLSGDGSISNLYQLQGMAADLGGAYTLTQDIDASASTSTDNADIWGGRGFAPVGVFADRFTGSLNGAGYVIDGLTINRPTQGAVGLIGFTGPGAQIAEVALTNVNIVGGLDNTGGLVGVHADGLVSGSYTTGNVSGGGGVGGLIGLSLASVESSYSTADVLGSANAIGGLIGFNADTGSLSNSYATGQVSGNIDVGGLVGATNAGTAISNSYATGQVTGNVNVGGFVGLNGGAILGSYWDSFTTGQVSAIGSDTNGQVVGEVNGDWATLVPADSAYAGGNYAGFDFVGDWFIAEGHSRPMLRTFLNYTTSGGNYQITNALQLQGMAADLSGSYVLMNDIDASVIAATGNTADTWGGRGFAPIGSYDAGNTLAFNGTFNGDGYVITGLTSNRTDQDYVGLFGRTWADASISNLGLLDVNIVGNDNVGALVGWHYGNISGVFVQDGNVTATGSQAGGIIGGNSGALADSYADVDVHAVGNNAGGLVGLLEAGSVQRTYALGSVTAGGANEGALVGRRGDTTVIENSFVLDTAGNAVGLGEGDGVSSLSSAEFMQLDSFVGWNISGQGGSGTTWHIYEDRSSPLLRSFLTPITVTAYDDTRVFDGSPYEGLHQINGTSGNGVRYGMNYAQFLAAFGEDGVPYTGPDLLGTTDLEYIGNSQGAVDAGTYTLTPSELWSTQLGYDIVINNGELVIDPLGIDITLTVNDASKTYGNADPVFTWGITSGAMAPGDVAQLTLSRQAGENVGNYTIFGTPVGDLDSGNYLVTVNDGVLTINPRPITLTIADATKIYGDVDPDFAWSITQGNLVFGQSLSGNFTRAPGENVGDYAISATPTGALATGNYAVSLVNGTLTISPRDIMIDISNLDKIYGETDPEFTWTISQGSLVEGDQLELSLTRAPGENVGSYAITSGGAQPNANYSYTINDGLLTISPRPLVLTADNLLKIYGEEDPELTWSITDGSLVGDDTLVVTVSREDGSNVGTYAIMLDAGGDAANSNYDLSLVDGQLQITPASLTVTANDVTSYWDLMPAFTASVDGLVNGDTEASVFGNSLSVISNLVIPVPGNYVLTPVAALIGENYQVSFVDGLLTLLSSNPGGNYIEALTSTQLPAREALGRERRSNIYEGRALLNGSEDDIVLHVLDGGVRLDPETLAAFGIVFPDAVNFPVNSAVVDERFFDKLREFVQQLNQFPNVQVLVEGHTSSTGSLALNQRLSERRADAVAKVLQDMGLESRRIRTEHFNYQRPVATNETPEGRYLNQRTEMVEDQQK